MGLTREEIEHYNRLYKKFGEISKAKALEKALDVIVLNRELSKEEAIAVGTKLIGPKNKRYNYEPNRSKKHNVI